jgi:SARP family transcriptional regulator, regulator of embCAB operon
LEYTKPVWIQLCGPFAVELAGRRIEGTLPARQGRLLFAYLTINRDRPIDRDELTDALWGEELPSAPGSALSALLSKIRTAFGPGVLQGRKEIRLVLPPGSRIDVETASWALHRAESGVAAGDWAGAYPAALTARVISTRRFLAGFDGIWIDEWRRRMLDVLVRALECSAASLLQFGGGEVVLAERTARELIERAPYRESGYRFLMQALTAQGHVAEALRVFEQLRITLREELGVGPGPEIQALHVGLLRGATS